MDRVLSPLRRLSDRLQTAAPKGRAAVMGIATLWVIFFHFNNFFHLDSEDLSLLPQILFYVFIYLGSGYGVNLFLFASGMGLMLAACRREQNGQRERLTAFYARRLSRLLPAYLIVAGIFYLGFHYRGVWPAMKSLTMLNFWIDGVRDYWYIAAILVLYLLFPLLRRCFARLGGEKATLAVLALVLAAEAVLYFFFRPVYKTHEIALLRVMPFVYGMLFAELLAGKKTDRVLLMLALSLAGMVAVLGLVALDVIAFPLQLQRHFASFSIPVLYALLISFIGLIRRFCRPLERMLCYLGSRSLELYLVHVTLIHDMCGMTFAPAWALALICAVATLLLSEALFQLVDPAGCLPRRLKARRA